MIEISINGAPHRLDAPLSVATLLESLGLADKRLAVEKDGQIVPRSCHATTTLEAGSRLEIVVAVGGG